MANSGREIRTWTGATTRRNWSGRMGEAQICANIILRVFVPSGRYENSPAIHCRVREPEKHSRAVRTPEI